jgi:hypothetical protein
LQALIGEEQMPRSLIAMEDGGAQNGCSTITQMKVSLEYVEWLFVLAFFFDLVSRFSFLI